MPPGRRSTGGRGRGIPEQAEKHGEPQGTQGIEVKGLAEVALGQREQRAGEAAERTFPSREPPEAADAERRLGRGREIPKSAQQQKGGGGAFQSASIVRCSKPTSCLYATVIAARHTGMAIKIPTTQHRNPSMPTSAISTTNMVKPK